MPITTPMETNLKLQTTGDVLLANPTHYHQVVATLIYLTIIRLDTAYVRHVVSPFVARPNFVHWAVVIQILHYLQDTTDNALLMPP